jgi:WD40 repeat protein
MLMRLTRETAKGAFCFVLLLILGCSTIAEVETARADKCAGDHPLLTLEHPDDPSGLLAYDFAPDSGSVYTITRGYGRGNRAIYQTDIRTGDHLRAGPVSTSLGPLTVSPDGARMVAGEYWIHGPSLAEVGKRRREGYTPSHIHFLPDQSYLHHVAGQNHVSDSRWLVKTFDGNRRILKLDVPESPSGPHENLDMAHTVSPDGTRLAVLFRDGQLRVWSLGDGELIASTHPLVDQWGPPPYGNERYASPNEDNTYLQFSPDGEHLWLHRPGYPLQKWRVGDEKPVTVEFPDELTAQARRIPSRLNHPYPGFAADQERDTRASGKTLRPTDAPPADLILPVHFPDGRGASWESDFPYLHRTRSRITADGKTAATMLENGHIALWDIANRKVVRVLPVDVGEVHSMWFDFKFSPNGQLIAIRTSETALEIWRVDDEQDGDDEGRAIIIDDRRLGPWSESVDGIRTRMLLYPVHPDQRHPKWLRLPPDPARTHGAFWQVRLRITCPGNDRRTFVDVDWPARSDLFRIIGPDGQPIALRHQPKQPAPAPPIGVIHTNQRERSIASWVLGSYCDFQKLGEYRIQFMGAADITDSDGNKHPGLPASPPITFIRDALGDGVGGTQRP